MFVALVILQENARALLYCKKIHPVVTELLNADGRTDRRAGRCTDR